MITEYSALRIDSHDISQIINIHTPSQKGMKSGAVKRFHIKLKLLCSFWLEILICIKKFNPFASRLFNRIIFCCGKIVNPGKMINLCPHLLCNLHGSVCRSRIYHYLL